MPTILGANTLSSGYEVENSLRFDDGSSAFLSKTFSGDGTSHDVGTVSFWIKRCELDAEQGIFTAGSSNRHFIRFESNNTFTFRAVTDSFHLNTNQIFRETSGWYHFVIAYDTTQGTGSNRVKIYVNGVQLTSFATADYPDQNLDIKLGAAEANHIGNDAEQTNPYYDGYMAEFVYIDGQQLAPTSFGEFDEDSPNIWKPIDVSGLTFGTNGFYLEFKQTGTSANSSGMGADTSGNDNHFGTSGLASTDVTEDTCTNNFAVLNPLTIPSGSSLTLSEGNLDVNGNSTDVGAKATLGVSAGKWYWEIKAVSASSGSDRMLVATENVRQITSATDENSQGIWGIQSRSGSGATLNSFTNGTFSNGNSGSTGFNDNTIIGVALDADNGKLYFHKDGTYTDLSGNTGNPANGTNPTFTGLPTDGTFLFPYVENRLNGTPSSQVNFGGAPSFSISSGNTDGKYGNFEYAPPSGYYALCTKRLAEFG